MSHFDVCFKCKKRKPLTSFYIHPQMDNGHLGKCKACTKKDVGEHRQKNRERIMEYDRQRSNLPHRKAMRQRITQQFKKEHPKSWDAHVRVNNAVRDRRLFKPEKCSRCNQKTRLEGHHRDYRKALDVKWLCNFCHKMEHGRVKYVSNPIATK